MARGIVHTSPTDPREGRFEVFEGDGLTLSFTATDEDGDALDISAASAILWGAFPKAAGKVAPGGSILWSAYSIGSGVTLVDDGSTALRGQFTVALAASDTSGLTATDYYYEARVTLSAIPQTMAYGIMHVRESGLS